MQLIAPLKTANVQETFDDQLDETEINSDHRKDKRKFLIRELEVQIKMSVIRPIK